MARRVHKPVIAIVSGAVAHLDVFGHVRTWSPITEEGLADRLKWLFNRNPKVPFFIHSNLNLYERGFVSGVLIAIGSRALASSFPLPPKTSARERAMYLAREESQNGR